jgi:DNA-binding MarR family transcriptional regulator
MDVDAIKVFRDRIRQVQQKFGGSQRNDIQCCGVTMAQCYALMAVGDRGELSIVELAGILGVDTSNLSRTVDSMVKSGLVNRILNPQDRRYVLVTLTDGGRKTFETIERLFNAYLSRVFEFIPQEKHRQIMESLDLVATALDKCGATYQCCSPEP